MRTPPPPGFRCGRRRSSPRWVTMPYRRFGATGLQVSEVGFGAWAIGGKAYGSVDNAESLRALARAEELGCNLVDTAMVYGESEVVLGQFLKGRRDRWIVATKYSYQPAGMTATLEAQLRRLAHRCRRLLPAAFAARGARHVRRTVAAEEGRQGTFHRRFGLLRLTISTRPSIAESSTGCSFPSACWIRIPLNCGSSGCARADLRS